MVDWDEFTDAQKEVIGELPNTTSAIAENLNVEPATVRARIMRVNERAPEGEELIATDHDGLRVWNGKKDLHRMKTHHTGSITRELNNVLTDDEAGIKALLNSTEPVAATQDPEPDHQDLVIFITDLHFGDRVRNERGIDTYNTEIATERVNRIVQNALDYKRKEARHTEFDAIHLVLGGDQVTGSAIYEGQWENLDPVGPTIKHQINNAADALMSAIKTLHKETDHLQVICQPGNHGESRASGVSKQANADIHLYSRLDFGVRHAGLKGVNFVFHDSTRYTNFKMRGGKQRGHVRHGQGCQKHAGATAASKRDWRGWLNMHDFTVAFRGHYHEAKVERVLGAPVIMGGSPKPPGDFEESISEWGGPGAVMLGVSDEQPIEWMRFIDF